MDHETVSARHINPPPAGAECWTVHPSDARDKALSQSAEGRRGQVHLSRRGVSDGVSVRCVSRRDVRRTLCTHPEKPESQSAAYRGAVSDGHGIAIWTTGRLNPLHVAEQCQTAIAKIHVPKGTSQSAACRGAVSDLIRAMLLGWKLSQSAACRGAVSDCRRKLPRTKNARRSQSAACRGAVSDSWHPSAWSRQPRLNPLRVAEQCQTGGVAAACQGRPFRRPFQQSRQYGNLFKEQNTKILFNYRKN